jgi:hypothetical protein
MSTAFTNCDSVLTFGQCAASPSQRQEHRLPHFAHLVLASTQRTAVGKTVIGPSARRVESDYDWAAATTSGSRDKRASSSCICFVVETSMTIETNPKPSSKTSMLSRLTW